MSGFCAVTGKEVNDFMEALLPFLKSYFKDEIQADCAAGISLIAMNLIAYQAAPSPEAAKTMIEQCAAQSAMIAKRMGKTK